MTRILQACGIAVCLIVIVSFVTGKRSLDALIHPQEANLPPKPMDLKYSPVITSESFDKPQENCESFSNIKAVVLRGAHSSPKTSGPAWELLTTEDGQRGEYGWDDEMNHVTSGWLDEIMIPGRRLVISGRACGSGGQLSLTQVEARDR